MKQALICIVIFSAALFSFKTKNKREILVRTWHAVDLSSPQLDSFYNINKMFIDTMGSHSDTATKLQIYGSTNMDSVRHLLQFELDSFMTTQTNSIKTTTFQFRNDSVAFLSFDNMGDSCKWYLDEAGALKLLPINENDELVKNLHIQLISVSESALKLKFVEDNGYTIVTFSPKIK